VSDYNWWKFLHIAGVLGLVLAHGTSAAMAFRLRKERDRTRIQTLLQLSGSTIITFYVSFLILVVFGSIAATRIGAWSHRWIQYSIGVLVVITVVMLGMARPYYRKVKEAIALRPSGEPRISDEELDARLRSGVPIWNILIGTGGLVAITWLMVFKPI